MRKISVLFIVGLFLIITGCLKEMPDRELTVSIADDNPVKNLQKLTDDKYKTSVMVLGVPPLNVLGKDFSPKLLDSLIIVLRKYSPEIICIDAIPSSQIQSYLNLDKYHKDLILSVSKNEIESATKLHSGRNVDISKLEERIDSLLNSKNDISSLTYQEKEKLIKDFLISFDSYSAALIWSYLNENEKSKLTLENSVKNYLTSLSRSNEENSSIGLRLARELKLTRLFRINDLSDRYYLNKIADPLYQEMLLSEVYRNSRKDILDLETDKKLKESLSQKNLMLFFRHINSKEYILRATDKNWGIYYRMFLDSGLDRARAALWEMKCFRIAANIREISAFNPGKKILVIVNVSAKPFIEEYLKSTADIKIRDFNEL